MSEKDEQMARAVARGIEHEKRAEAAGTGVGVIVFFAVAALVIFLGMQLNWGGWAGLWAMIAGGIAGAVMSSRVKASAMS